MGRPAIDLTGQTFGRLTVVKQVKGSNTKSAYWLCRCTCGEVKAVARTHLMKGTTQSCGCLQRESIGNRARTHGGWKTRLYSIWRHMKERCYKPYSPKYPLYGGRGITACNEWIDDFPAFRDWAMDNGYQDHLTLDRIDNNKGYMPQNCRWSTPSEQNRNRRPYHWKREG